MLVGNAIKQFSLFGDKAQTAMEMKEENTIWIGRSLDRMQNLHVCNVINVDVILQNDNQSFPIHFDRQNSRHEIQFTNSRLSLPLHGGNFGIDNLHFAG